MYNTDKLLVKFSLQTEKKLILLLPPFIKIIKYCAVFLEIRGHCRNQTVSESSRCTQISYWEPKRIWQGTETNVCY